MIERRSDAAGCVNKTKALELFSTGKEIKWAVWDKLFRHDSIGTIRFPAQKIHGEDVIFLLEFICSNDVFVYSDLGSYHYYRENKESFTKQSWNKSRLGLVKFYGALYEKLKQFGLDGSISSAEEKYLECIRSSYRRCIHYGYKKEAVQLRELMKKNITAVKDSELKTAYKIELVVTAYAPILAYVLNIGYKFVR